jgi:RNA polymerase sigma-70 factor (ECF subfamily)
VTFHAALRAVLPRLRSYALTLARDHDRANDLVQQTVLKALAAQATFRAGCFDAWIFRIARNEFISTLRTRYQAVEIGGEIEYALSSPATQDSRLVMREFVRAFDQLSLPHREALILSVVCGVSYEQIARSAGVSVGTVKSRVSRARDALEQALLHGVAPAAGKRLKSANGGDRPVARTSSCRKACSPNYPPDQPANGAARVPT